MRLALVLGLAVMLAALAARTAHAADSDQCQWLADRDVATRAARELAQHSEVVRFCEPCGDLAPGAPRTALRVTLQRLDGDATSVAIDGDPIDLAYTYVKTGEQQYRNLAQLAGCPASGVSPRLRIDAATRTGVLIRADPGAAAMPPTEPPSAAAAPTIYIQAPSPAGPALLLGCGTLLGILAAGALRRSARRRALHTPRAADLAAEPEARAID
jgi:hypothetical protein